MTFQTLMELLTVSAVCVVPWTVVRTCARCSTSHRVVRLELVVGKEVVVGRQCARPAVSRAQLRVVRIVCRRRPRSIACIHPPVNAGRECDQTQQEPAQNLASHSTRILSSYSAPSAPLISK